MQTTKKQITVCVQIVEGVTLNRREAAFLRGMAQFCRVHRMRGSAAAGALDDILAAAGIPVYSESDGPVHDLFEVHP